MKIHFKIPEQLKNTRFDQVLSSTILDCSRNRASLLIGRGEVLLEGTSKKPGYRVKTGELIEGIIPDEPNVLCPDPEPISLDILHEDAHIIVVNKAAGMMVHPALGNYTGTLVNALLYHDVALKEVGNDRSRAGIVHRLDKDTSGVVVIAKTDFALHFLQKEFKQRRVGKSYLALVEGTIDQIEGQIILPIGRHPVKRKLMCINRKNGRYARTDWTVKERLQKACLIEARLHTGRTHQIRVHFYAINHPLIGDRVYQTRRNRREKSLFSRQMLHSRKLSFRHPFSGKRVCFKASIPDDFAQTQKTLS
jgi:23S rRNA pseudouridine1911/1915/1917 synthase